MKETFQKALTAPVKERGFELKPEAVDAEKQPSAPTAARCRWHGAVVIAAITSCTNTCNPSVMVGAGLLAKKAVEKGLSVKPYVKTSLAPGSRVVTDYLKKANLLEPLAKLGFNVVAMAAPPASATAARCPVRSPRPSPARIWSPPRSFPGTATSRDASIPLVKANYLASPPLVVAYALAGTVDIDLDKEPLGEGTDGPVYLKDIWPTQEEIAEAIATSLNVRHVRRKLCQRFRRLRDVEGYQGLWRRDLSTGTKNPPTSITRLISRR